MSLQWVHGWMEGYLRILHWFRESGQLRKIVLSLKFSIWKNVYEIFKLQVIGMHHEDFWELLGWEEKRLTLRPSRISQSFLAQSNNSGTKNQTSPGSYQCPHSKKRNFKKCVLLTIKITKNMHFTHVIFLHYAFQFSIEIFQNSTMKPEEEENKCKIFMTYANNSEMSQSKCNKQRAQIWKINIQNTRNIYNNKTQHHE